MPQLSRPTRALQPQSMFPDKTEQKKQARWSDPTSPITSKFADQMIRKVIVVVSIVKRFRPCRTGIKPSVPWATIVGTGDGAQLSPQQYTVPAC